VLGPALPLQESAPPSPALPLQFRSPQLWAQPSLSLRATFSATDMAESPFPIIIDLGDDPGQWPADPYKSFTDTCVTKCDSSTCWHGQLHSDGRCENCKVLAKRAMPRATQAPPTAPLSYLCRRCFPVEQARINDSQCCPHHSPIDMRLTDEQLLFYETHLPGAEVNSTPKTTTALEHEQKGREKAYQTQQRAAPLTPNVHEEVAHLEGQVRTLQVALDQQRSQIDSLNEQIRHLLEMHKSLAHDLWARAAGWPSHLSQEIVLLHPWLH